MQEASIPTPSGSSPSSRSLADINIDHFAPLRGQGFKVVAPGGQEFDAVLENVTPLQAKGHLATRAPFSLIFRLENHRQPQQGTYQVQVPQLGPIDLFMVPILSPATGLVAFQAVFA